jgi:hypothetical protein
MAERWKETTPVTSEYVRDLALGIQSELDRQGISVSFLANLSGILAHTITGLLDRDLAPDNTPAIAASSALTNSTLRLPAPCRAGFRTRT